MARVPLLSLTLMVIVTPSACTRAHVLRPSPFTLDIVAFGDSITEGQNGDAPPGLCGQLLCIDVPNAYPTVLAGNLADGYPHGTIDVVNAGLGGEPAIGAGESRLPGVLATHSPQALLLLHGTNDLLANRPPADIATAIRNMIRTARSSGVTYVFVGTLLPQRAGGTPPRGTAGALVVPANNAIRPVVAAEGAILVDTYGAFVGNETTYLANDGLHVTPTGNRVIASLFFALLSQHVPALVRID